MTGLVSTDGHVDKKLNIRLALANETLIRDIFYLCRSIGLDASISLQVKMMHSNVGKLLLPYASLDIARLKKIYADDRLERLS